MKAQFSADDNVAIYLYGPDGALKEERHHKNLVVTAGKNWLPTFMAGTNTSQMVFLAIGTSVTAVNAADTILGNEVSNPRILGTTFTSQNIYQLTGTFGQNNPSATNTTPITEAGIFNMLASGAGSMYTHAVFAAINKAPADTLQLVWQVTNS